MVGTFYDGHDEFYHHAKSGEIEQRATAVRAKIWCFYVFFVFLSRSEASMLFVQGLHSSNLHCVTVNGSILMWFSTFFQTR